ncbi:MAG: hypothetical protein M3437_17450 [Chloroflexota bacterium]|nr:hypothetical protein [Chloroflexota bacterium]MDQ5866981.1 hypothetical protein [Chloroflexota bacterium]
MHHRNPPTTAKRTFLPIFTVLVLLATSLIPASARQVNIATPQATEELPQPVWIAPRGGEPLFVVGANYEGPVDRAWLMWEDDKFDVGLIEQDFSRASAFGINTLRIFVQKPLRDDINAGDFSKLDAVTSLARKHNLYLLVTFTDWAEPDLARAAALNGKIAAHLAEEPSILAYDVKNEPQFSDVIGAIYSSVSLTVPLQVPDTVSTYGERVTRADLASYRQSSEGRSVIPARMTEDQAYSVANYYKLYLELLNAGAAWVRDHPNTTTLDYLDSPEAASWAPYLRALDETMGAWVSSQIATVRAADPGRPITTGYSNVVLAKMPSNRQLDFQSVHRFTSHGYAGLNGTFLVLENLRRTFAGQPVMLEEFGYPGAVRNGSGVTGYDPRTTANLESAVWVYLYSRGFAGGAKWMLNNFPAGDNPAENSYGLFDNDGKPKLTAYALRHLSDLFGRHSPGTFSDFRSEASSAVNFAYKAHDALVAGGKVYTSTNLTFQANAPSQLVVGTRGGTITLFATDVATSELHLPTIFGIATQDLGKVVLTGNDPAGRPAVPSQPTLNGDWLRINLAPLYSYRLSVVPRAVEQAPAQVDANTVYFPQTGHNLTGEFLKYWQAHGGLAIFGYPLTEAFTEGGYTVQYFERNRFELHPENQPPYNVLLGRLGADLTTGRTFAGVAPFESSPGHVYFPETGHSLHFGFLGYWERNGGLAQFGYPLSEEIREVSPTDGKEYTVQYFERARFEYHPEYKGTPAEVLLGLLGVGTMKDKGWIP